MGLRTITVGQLIEALQREDPEAMVIFSADYGDRGHTPQALPIRGQTETTVIVKSAYSTSGWALADDDEYDEQTADQYEPYVVIR